MGRPDVLLDEQEVGVGRPNGEGIRPLDVGRGVEEAEGSVVGPTRVDPSPGDRDDPPFRGELAPDQAADVSKGDPGQAQRDPERVETRTLGRCTVGGRRGDRVRQPPVRAHHRHGPGHESGQLAEVAARAPPQRETIDPAHDLADDAALAFDGGDQLADREGLPEQHLRSPGSEPEPLGSSGRRQAHPVLHRPGAVPWRRPAFEGARIAVEPEDDVRLRVARRGAPPGPGGGFSDRPEVDDPGRLVGPLEHPAVEPLVGPEQDAAGPHSAWRAGAAAHDHLGQDRVLRGPDGRDRPGQPGRATPRRDDDPDRHGRSRSGLDRVPSGRHPSPIRRQVGPGG